MHVEVGMFEVLRHAGLVRPFLVVVVVLHCVVANVNCIVLGHIIAREAVRCRDRPFFVDQRSLLIISKSSRASDEKIPPHSCVTVP